MQLPIRHARFATVEQAIFEARVVADCVSHTCKLVKRGDRTKLDACCQYGVDVDLGERDAILARREEIGALLEPAARAQPWFEDAVTADRDFPSGAYVRTRRFGEGCVFQAHDGRGCAIHRASLEGGWDFHGTKPHVCRLFPLSYDATSLLLSDDFRDYSCADVADAPTVYRVSRDALAAIFGADLVVELDRIEASLPRPRRRLTLLGDDARVDG